MSRTFFRYALLIAGIALLAALPVSSGLAAKKGETAQVDKKDAAPTKAQGQHKGWPWDVELSQKDWQKAIADRPISGLSGGQIDKAPLAAPTPLTPPIQPGAVVVHPPAAAAVAPTTKGKVTATGLMDDWQHALAPAALGGPPSATQSAEEIFLDAPSQAAAKSLAASAEGQTDAQCGVANGAVSEIAPSVNLCASGSPGEVSGKGPWRWTCFGERGGVNVSCISPSLASVTAAQAVDGQCGSAQGTGVTQAPGMDLCTSGIASPISGDGPWSWACSGLNGGRVAACRALVREDGVCGSASGQNARRTPANDLCSSGLASAVVGEGPWSWTCSGLNGGEAANCEAGLSIDGVCGLATASGTRKEPDADLCQVGEPSEVAGTGPWNWTCSGSKGGAAATCIAAVSIDGQCGRANGETRESAPTSNLCASGLASVVAGDGPWVWSCGGQDGGMTVSCTSLYARNPAQIAQASADPELAVSSSPAPVLAVAETEATGRAAAEMTARVQPSKPKKRPDTLLGMLGLVSEDDAPPENAETQVAAPAPVVTGNEPKKETKTVSDTKPAGQCGAAAGVGTIKAPTSGLCAQGIAGNVTGEGPWSWDCTDKKTRAAVTCVAPLPVLAACGPAHGKTVSSVPSDGLCRSGTASPVMGSGPWSWVCEGGAGGTNASCTAPYTKAVPVARIAQTESELGADLVNPPEHPAFGAKNSTPVAHEPVQEASDAKAAPEKPSEAYMAAVAPVVSPRVPAHAPSAPLPPPVDGLCGAAALQDWSVRPEGDLCASGKTGTVEGRGPWRWTCAGENGGRLASCVAQLQAVPPVQPPAQKKTATMVDGVCGTAVGAPRAMAPTESLCASGIPSAVSGQGPWSWACSGLNGGVAQTCVATVLSSPQPVAPMVNAACGAANGVPASSEPRENLCVSGSVSVVSGLGPWAWTCYGANGGTTVSCAAPVTQAPPLDGACGAAHNVAAVERPLENLCQAGIPSLVNGNGPWTWTCSGINGGVASGCLAPRRRDGAPVVVPAPVTAPVLSLPSPSKGLVTPRLATKPASQSGQSNMSRPTTTNNIQPGVTNYAPAPPVRSNALQPAPLRSSAQELQSRTSSSAASAQVSILFTPGSDYLGEEGLKTLIDLASKLLAQPSSRLSLTAYAGGTNGLSPRDARRLSLARAMTVRDELMGRGVDANRIDVRVQGANLPDDGPMDRVDLGMK